MHHDIHLVYHKTGALLLRQYKSIMIFICVYHKTRALDETIEMHHDFHLVHHETGALNETIQMRYNIHLCSS